MEGENRYTGLWITRDGYIRQELLPGGRYDEARGDRLHAYTGSYQIKGDKIDYWDDTGFSASGRFNGDVLYHGGYTFYREKEGKEKMRRNLLTQLSYLF
jgi:hypothetical protein